MDQIDRVGRNTLAGAAIPVSGLDVAVAVQEVEAIKSPLGKVKPSRIRAACWSSIRERISGEFATCLMQTGFARRDLNSAVYPLHHAKSELVAKVIQEFMAEASQTGGTANSPIAPGAVHMRQKRHKQLAAQWHRGRCSNHFAVGVGP